LQPSCCSLRATTPHNEEDLMSEIRVIVVSPEEAYDGTAEFWCGSELMGVTMLSERGLQLRIDARADGQPWLLDTTSLARGLYEANRVIASY
jgi:hypothetical protein